MIFGILGYKKYSKNHTFIILYSEKSHFYTFYSPKILGYKKYSENHTFIILYSEKSYFYTFYTPKILGYKKYSENYIQPEATVTTALLINYCNFLNTCCK